MDIPNVKMNTDNMSNEELETLFTESYEQTIAYGNEIAEFEALCERQPHSSKVTMLVNIVGFAGTPTVEQYHDGKVNEVFISRADKGTLRFLCDVSKTMPLGGIDYQVVYESE